MEPSVFGTSSQGEVAPLEVAPIRRPLKHRKKELLRHKYRRSGTVSSVFQLLQDFLSTGTGAIRRLAMRSVKTTKKHVLSLGFWGTVQEARTSGRDASNAPTNRLHNPIAGRRSLDSFAVPFFSGGTAKLQTMVTGEHLILAS